MALAGALRALTGFERRTMQSVAINSFFLKTSLQIRLIVLRVTARCANRFATTTPNRACGELPFLAYKVKCSVLFWGLKRKTDEKSSVLTMRISREK